MDTLEKSDHSETESEETPDFGDTPGAPLRLAMWQLGQDLLSRIDQARHDLSDENVHECRVASRRLQFCLEAAAEVTGRKSARKILRKTRVVQKALGKLRDIHVQQKWLERHPELSEIGEHLKSAAEELGAAARRDLHKIKLKKLELQLEGFDVYLAGLTSDDESFEPARDRLVQATRASFDEAVEAATHIDSQISDTFHPLRLTLKKLRYRFELLESLGDDPSVPRLDKSQLEHLKELHHSLGAMQDTEQLCRRLDRFWESTPPVRRTQHRILGVLLKERDRLVSRLSPTSLKLETLWPVAEAQPVAAEAPSPPTEG